MKASRNGRKHAILAVEMEHDTRWKEEDGVDRATCRILVPDGSIYLPTGYYQGRWIYLNGENELHARALDNLQAREFFWQVNMWTLALPPQGDAYRPEREFVTDQPVKIDELEEIAVRCKQEAYDSINPRHYVAQGWKARTIANKRK